MLNVCMLTSFFTPQLGGPYNVITEIQPYFEEKGINTDILTTSFIDQVGFKRTEFFEKISNKFSIYRFESFFRFREYRISFGLLPFLLKNAKNLDIIHSHAFRSFQEDMGVIFSIMKNKPLIISTHGGININWDYSDKIPKMIHDKTLGFFNRKLVNPYFIAVSKSEISILREYGIDDDHITYIPNGVNTNLFRPMNSEKLKENYKLNGYDILLYVGRIAKGKGLDVLIKTLYKIVEKKKNIKLIIAGSDSGYLSRVKLLINHYNIASHIIYTGFIPKHALPEYYSIADIVIYPSRQEIFGLVLIEAMACGKVVIGSDILGPSEIIENGKTGYTSDFKDFGKLSNQIIDLLSDKQLLKEIGKNAVKRVKEHYTWENSANAHIKLYKKILSG